MGFLDNLFGLAFAPYQNLMDSLGLTSHGRDMVHQEHAIQDQMNFQQSMTNQQQQFTLDMYNRQWQDMLSKYPQVAKILSDVQFNQWKNQFDLQNQWNSPANQVKLALQAGINPNSIYGGSGSVASSSMGATSVPMSPQISPTPFTSHASPIGVPQGIGRSSMTEVSSFLKDLAQAKKFGVETDQLEKLFTYEVQERSARIFGQQLSNDAQGIANFVAENTKDTKVRKATEELLNIIASTENLDADSSLKLEKLFTEKSEQLMNYAKAHLDVSNRELLQLKIDNFAEEFRTTMANIRADTENKHSQARLNNALRETENQLRQGRVTALEWSNKIAEIERDMKQNDLWIQNRTVQAQVDSIIEKARREHFISESAYEDWQQNKVVSKWADRQQFADYCTKFLGALGSVLGGAGSAVSGAANWKNVKLNNINMRDRNDIAREFNRIYEDGIKRQPDFNQIKRDAVLGPNWNDNFR